MNMLLSHIHLTHFRNFDSSSFEFSPHLTLIVGENARGKTSLLEAIYVAVYGTGFRETRELELLAWEQGDGLIDAVFADKGQRTRFQVRLQLVDSRVKKTYLVNKTVQSVREFRKNQTQAVLFAPEHIHLITGSPGRRRRYLDEVISAVNPPYKKSLHNYENALRRRNKILETYEDEAHLDEELRFWDEYLIEHGGVITAGRQAYIDYLNTHPSVDGKEFAIVYHKDPFSAHSLATCTRKERLFRRTLIGPQKDDIDLYLTEPEGEKKNVAQYGSRSEQRMAIFWLKLNELQYFEQAGGQKPVLLLDDIFSELDARNRVLVMHMIREYQTVATTTDEDIKNISLTPELVIRL